MATEFVTPRDGSGQSRQLLPPSETLASISEALVGNDGSFFVASRSYDYPTLAEIEAFDHTDLSLKDAYASYMFMPKELADTYAARQLEEIGNELRRETMPHYLVAAGWAMAESALVRIDRSSSERQRLLNDALTSWERALAAQNFIETYAESQHIEYAYGHRIALDIATLPLFRDIIEGDVTKEACEQVFLRYLNILQSNAIHINLMSKAGNIEGLSAHVGLGYEGNALLAFNRRLSRTWFAIPSTARSDSGYFYPRQTHDLLVLHQKYGAIQSATPVEIKAKPSARDRNRYDALLVRGKMHLCVEGKYTPAHTLSAIAAVYEGRANAEEQEIADSATKRFASMVRDYYAGEALGSLVGEHSVTVFHDTAQVIAHHPGLERSPAA